MGALAILTGLAVVVLWWQSATTDGGEDAADDRSDGWNTIPSWQYEGRHVESGSLARGEQERVLQNIQQ